MNQGPRGPLMIKICGLTEEEHVDAAAESGADLVGFVLWSGSVRCVTLDRAESLAARAHARGLGTVALVVDPTPGELAALDGAAAIDRIQCHGDETCAALARVRLPTMKGFSFSPPALETWDRCPHATWLLADGPRGGGGACFDHAALAALMPRVTKPVVLAGGLAPSNVASAIALVRPFGVDVSSGVERTRGVKDVGLIAAFCRAARDADVM